MKTILFPTDFSPGADNALNYAIGLCNKLNAKLLLFNSFHIPAYTSQTSMDEDVEEQLMTIAQDEIQSLKNKIVLQNKNLEADYSIGYGLAVDNILSTAEEKHADLIIMGTKGASGLKEVFIGSNAATVLEKASCPVLVIPENTRFKPIEKIVFATNFRESDFDSLIFLLEIAALFNAEISIVHISQVSPTENYESDLLQWYKEALKKRTNTEYRNISFHVLTAGNVDDELEDFIEKNTIDLLSLSMRKRTIFSRLFDRSLTKKMAYHSHIPLLAFHASKKKA